MLLNQTSEPAGDYHVTPANDPRVQRMCEFIQELMNSTPPDEQAWLESYFKFSMRQYKQMVSTSNQE